MRSYSTASTVGEIARRLRTPVHRIAYVVRTRGLRPVAWAGNARIFTEQDVARIASELQQINEDRAAATEARQQSLGQQQGV